MQIVDHKNAKRQVKRADPPVGRADNIRPYGKNKYAGLGTRTQRGLGQRPKVLYLKNLSCKKPKRAV